jgi:hypothetical protein
VNLLLSSDSSVRLFFPKGGSGSIVFVIRRLIRSEFSDLPTYLMYDGPVLPAYNPSFSSYFFSRNNIFLSQQISQQCFSAGLSAQPNGPMCCSVAVKPWPLATRTHGWHAIGREVVWLVAYRASNTNAADSRSYDYFHQLKKLGVIRVVCLRI